MAVAGPPPQLWTRGKPPAADCQSVSAEALSRIAATRNPLISVAGSLPLEPGLVQQIADARKRTHVSVHSV